MDEEEENVNQQVNSLDDPSFETKVDKSKLQKAAIKLEKKEPLKKPV